MRPGPGRELPRRCRAIREAASAALDGEVTGGERLGVADHLERCDPCARHATRIARVSGLIGSLAVRLVPCLLLLLVVLAPAPALGDDPVVPVVVEAAVLGRTRLEHALRCELVVRNATAAAVKTRVRLVVKHEGGAATSEWLDLGELAPGRWKAARPDVKQIPAGDTPWRVELEAGGRTYAYVADDPEKAPELVDAVAPTGGPTAESVGCRAEWEGDARGPRPARGHLGRPGPGRLPEGGHAHRRAPRRRGPAGPRPRDARQGRARARRAQGAVVQGRPREAGAAVVAILRDPEPDRRAFELDVEVRLSDGRKVRFERLGPPYRNDPVPPAR